MESRTMSPLSRLNVQKLHQGAMVVVTFIIEADLVKSSKGRKAIRGVCHDGLSREVVPDR